MVQISLLHFHETACETKPDQVLFKRKPVQYVAKSPILEDQEVRPADDDDDDDAAVFIKTLIGSRYGRLKQPTRSSSTTRIICNGKPAPPALPQGHTSEQRANPTSMDFYKQVRVSPFHSSFLFSPFSFLFSPFPPSLVSVLCSHSSLLSSSFFLLPSSPWID